MFCPKNIFSCLHCFLSSYREVNIQRTPQHCEAFEEIEPSIKMSLGIHFYLTAPDRVGSDLLVAVLRFAGSSHHQPPQSFFLRVTGFVKTVSIMRLRRRFMLEVGASPSLILFCARGSGSAGLGRGEIRSTSATGGGSETALDLKVEKEKVKI